MGPLRCLPAWLGWHALWQAVLVGQEVWPGREYGPYDASGDDRLENTNEGVDADHDRKGGERQGTTDDDKHRRQRTRRHDRQPGGNRHGAEVSRARSRQECRKRAEKVVAPYRR